MAESTATLRVGSLASVKVGRKWHSCKIVRLTHQGTVAEVDRLDDNDDKTIYAQVVDLRVRKKETRGAHQGKVR